MKIHGYRMRSVNVVSNEPAETLTGDRSNKLGTISIAHNGQAYWDEGHGAQRVKTMVDPYFGSLNVKLPDDSIVYLSMKAGVLKDATLEIEYKLKNPEIRKLYNISVPKYLKELAK